MPDRTSSDITVGAPAAEIMSVIADFAAYPQWASGVRAAEVLSTDGQGRPETVKFTLDAGLIKDSYVLAYTWAQDTSVSWVLAERGAMVAEMAGSYQLTETGGSTKVRYDLEVGLSVPMIGMLKRRAEKTIIDTALKGLKSRAERIRGSA